MVLSSLGQHLPQRRKGLLALVVFIVAYSSFSTSRINSIEIVNDAGDNDEVTQRSLRAGTYWELDLGIKRQRRLRRQKLQLQMQRNSMSNAEMSKFNRVQNKLDRFTNNLLNRRNKNQITTEEISKFIKIHEMLNAVPTKHLLNRFHKQVEIPPNQAVDAVTCKHSEMGFTQKDSDCYRLLSPRMKSKRAWFFFGDSQMGKLVQSISKIQPYEASARKSKADGGCGFLDYCHLEKAKTWIPPPPTRIQGPITYGLQTPFCSDIASAGNQLLESNTSDGGIRLMEYLVVDFASDVEQQTTYTRTTQETATLHVANQLQLRSLTNDDSVCVVNSGLHDMMLCIGRSNKQCEDIYITNVDTYLSLLGNVCGSIVWIATTPVKGDPRFAQENSNMKKWNGMVNELIAQKYHNAYFVNIWDVAEQHTHIDNAHFTPEYYDRLGNLFSSLM